MKKFLLLSISLLAIVSACTNLLYEDKAEIPQQPGGEYEEGRLHIKLSESPASEEELYDLLSPLGEFTAVRMFPPAGEFEERHIAYGLDRWYTVSFSTELPTTKAHGLLDRIKDVEIVEFDYKIEQTGSFNDPYLSDQWHYQNDGSKNGSIAGSDINLFKAWGIESGDPDVIVAICDGGIDYSHPDLARNMWINYKELNGSEGIDDDNNGYVDDIYGFNFTVGSDGESMKGKIEADNHGTHVAGTVAAVNNNGIGVSGIAGGDGSADSGIRLMSIQTSPGSAYISAGIVYAADNGAVLMNCSWSLAEAQSTPAYLLNSFNYFNETAGTDKNGHQTGPMKGGLIFFAAGNEHKNKSIPAIEESVKAVASIGADYKLAYYSNFGSWVDYTTPGGDAEKGFNILSTLPGGAYGYMQGTSMAAPHATGVAALVVSKFKANGFTREKLINILDKTADPIILEYNDSYTKEMGAGLLDAYAAVKYMNNPPVAVDDLSGEAKANSIQLSWTVPGTDKDGPTFAFRVFWSKKSLSSLDSSNPGADVSTAHIDASDIAIGQTVEYLIPNLEFGSTYHIVVVGENIEGKLSEASNEITVTTVANQKPIIEVKGSTEITIASHEKAIFEFFVSDPEDQELSIKVEPASDAATLSIDGKKVIVSVDALKLNDNASYNFELVVNDPFVAVKQAFGVEIKANNDPKLLGQISDIVLNSIKDAVNLDMKKFFTDPDGEQLKYTFSYEPSPVIREEVNNDDLKISAFSYGSCTVNIDASDMRGKSVRNSFKVLVRDGSMDIDIFPNPVTDYVNIRLPEEKTVSIRVSNKLGAVIFSQESIQIGPFNPCRVDLSEQPSGVYYVVIKDDTYNKTYSIVKK